MNRRKAASVFLIVAIISTATLVIFHDVILPPAPPKGPTEETTEIVYDPFNDLSWWDIASELGDIGDIMTPLLKFATIGNRFDETAGYYSAAQYVMGYFNGLGIDASYWGNHDSVVAHQQGYGTDKRAIVFGAHLDSGETGIGIEQNAGGVAVVMAIGTILSHYRLPIDVYYCFFAGNMVFLDEQKVVRAMWGSKEISAQLAADDVDVIAFYNFDELLLRDPLQPESSRLLAEHNIESTYGYHKTTYLGDLLNSFMKQAGLNIMSVVESSTTQTDHTSFWAKGFPAINVKSGHQPNPDFPVPDTPHSNGYNMTQALYLAKAAASVAVFLGMQGNGQPTQELIKTTLQPGNSTVHYAVMTSVQKPVIHGTVSNTTVLKMATVSGSSLLKTNLNPGNVSITSDTDAPLGIIRVTLTNPGSTNVTLSLYLEYVQDTDGDSTPDSEQYSWPPPDPPLDWDGDGLSDVDELSNHTDRFSKDTDRDSISDYIEIINGMDPLRDDTAEDLDGDGLNNLQEINIGTSPISNDTDSDSLPDGWEVKFKTNPLVNDALDDPDNDTLTNLAEYQHGSDPLSIDGDHDGLTDVEEVTRGMNPLNPDTDGDQLNDFLEVRNHIDPLNPDFDHDFIPDGVDPNPKVNQILIILLLSIVPIFVGSVVMWRKIR
ncbi:MAG: M28 family peptidase [Candidatus Thorarchaeota archaeon]|nr:M28 family peptidase [Candidatus Thorarchaeota archaeon]